MAKVGTTTERKRHPRRIRRKPVTQKETARLRGPFPFLRYDEDQLTLIADQAAATAL
jgi:hypothetical protein